jgi:hypothetical protein
LRQETAFLAASSRSVAELMLRPDSFKSFLALSTFVPEYILDEILWFKFIFYDTRLFYYSTLPSRRTMSGTLSPMFLQAAMTPPAIVAQFTIPPKTFTKIALTLGSVILRNCNLEQYNTHSSKFPSYLIKLKTEEDFHPHSSVKDSCSIFVRLIIVLMLTLTTS